jgi:hypothetical protein
MAKAKAKDPGSVKIISKVSGYNGESAGVQFRDGVGETSDPWRIQWFLDHGYTVEDSSEKKPAEKKPPAKAAPNKVPPAQEKEEEDEKSDE